MRELDVIRVSALLHDIGKLECWAKQKPWSEHVHYTYEFVKCVLGEEVAVHAMRHHTGSSYSSEVFPKDEVEKIVSIADNLASGADRPEDAVSMGSKPSFPLELTHVLSGGDIVRKSWDMASLAYLSKVLETKLKQPCSVFSSDSEKAYFEVFRVLEDSDLSYVPADTRKPVNDVSLWDHMRLTAAFSTCIFLDGGYEGNDLSKYHFALISGDADRISRFVNVSSRLPDLNARSEKIKQATLKAKDAVVHSIGPECLIFAGGGGLFVVSPVSLAEKVCSLIKESFEAETQGQVTVTVNCHNVAGAMVQKEFGKVWEEAQRQMRIRKAERPVMPFEVVSEENEVCDVCHVKPASYNDASKVLPYDASPRPERLCESCWHLRLEGRGESLDQLKDGKNTVAVIKADGDGIGKVLSGEKFSKFSKVATPSRLATFSRYLNDVCEKEIDQIVRKTSGRCLVAGGDDVLAVVPGNQALALAMQMSDFFRKEMAMECTLSAGVAIFRHDLPIYAALESVNELLRFAKASPKKNSVAFAFILGVGLTKEEVSKVMHGPMGWNRLGEILSLAKAMAQGGFASTQLRRVAEAALKDPVFAEMLIKNLMGKGEKGRGIGWSEGEQLLSHLESRVLLDAFTVYNAFKD